MKNTDFVLGGYKPLNTPIHRLDTRVKTIALIALMIAIFLPYGNDGTTMYPFAMSMLVGAGIFLFIVLLAIIGKISPWRMLSSLKALIPLFVIVAILNIAFYRPDSSWLNQNVLFYIGDYPIYETGFWFSGYVIERIILSILGTMTLVSATKPMDIAYAVEWYLKPLELLKLPIKAFSMLTSLALRFIPLLNEQAHRIQKAQAARGLDSRNGNFKTKIKALTGLVLPLLLLSCQDAVQVAEAMMARGYDPKGKRTKYRTTKVAVADFIWLGVFLAVIALSLFLCFYQPNGLRIDAFMGL